ncbi:hypothetical protein SDC9_27652 [bioreactor metagenome]|uniref:Uncharacterized protein n=1 Tax=bioreactor metagenome TaxID=1076179 RepID=A0A644USF1_9ZZZZ
MILLWNGPVPEPSVVWLSDSVGFWPVLQHTPLADTAAPPLAVTLPPLIAVDEVILVTEAVVTVGIVIVGDVVKLS